MAEQQRSPDMTQACAPESNTVFTFRNHSNAESIRADANRLSPDLGTAGRRPLAAADPLCPGEGEVPQGAFTPG